MACAGIQLKQVPTATAKAGSLCGGDEQAAAGQQAGLRVEPPSLAGICCSCAPRQTCGHWGCHSILDQVTLIILFYTKLPTGLDFAD